MNKKVSGAKLVLVPIRQMGINYFPHVEDLKDRYIKYIDFAPAAYLPQTPAAGLTTNSDIYVTLTDQVGNRILFNEMPLQRFDYTATLGHRQPVAAKLSLQNCKLVCNDPAAVGKTAAMVFYYDLPEFSARNTADLVVVDSLTVPLTTATFYNSLPDVERMAGKRFRRLLVSTPTTTPDYQAGVTAAQMQNLYLTLRKGSYCVLDNMPVSLLQQLQMIDETEWANIIFDLQGSFITIGGAGTIPTIAQYLGKSVFFNFAYEK